MAGERRARKAFTARQITIALDKLNSLGYHTVYENTNNLSERRKMSTIAEIHEHLKAGNEVALLTAYKTTIFDQRHVDYIRADGNGFRLGWPGKKSVYAFANQFKLVPAGMTLKRHTN